MYETSNRKNPETLVDYYQKALPNVIRLKRTSGLIQKYNKIVNEVM